MSKSKERTASELVLLDAKKVRVIQANMRVSADSEIDALAESIKQNGQVQPIIARKTGDLIEVVAGSRRVEACRKLGRAVLAMLHEQMSDEQAAAIMLEENLKRKNLTILDKAAQFRLAMGMSNRKPEEMAKSIGMTEAEYAQILEIDKLTRPWRQIAEYKSEGTWRSTMSDRHWLYIARCPASFQNKYLSDIIEGGGKVSGIIKDEKLTDEQLDDLFQTDIAPFSPNFEEFKAQIDLRLSPLGNAMFDQADETLDPKAGACTTCPNRTNNRELLFEDFELTEGGECTDTACYTSKVQLHILRVAEATKAETGKTPIMLAKNENFSFRNQSPVVDAMSSIDGRTDVKAKLADRYEAARKNDPDAIPAIVMDGKKPGTVKYVKLKEAEQDENSYDGEEDAEQGSQGGGEAPAGVQSKPQLSEREIKEQRLSARRKAFVIKTIVAKLEQMINDPNTVPPSRVNYVALLFAFGTSRHAKHTGYGCAFPEAMQEFIGVSKVQPGEDDLPQFHKPYELHESFINSDEETRKRWNAIIKRHIFMDVAKTLVSRLQYATLETIKSAYQEAVEICRMFGDPFNLEELEKLAEAEIKKPKSLQQLENQSGEQPAAGQPEEPQTSVKLDILLDRVHAIRESCFDAFDTMPTPRKIEIEFRSSYETIQEAVLEKLKELAKAAGINKSRVKELIRFEYEKRRYRSGSSLMPKIWSPQTQEGNQFTDTEAEVLEKLSLWTNERSLSVTAQSLLAAEVHYSAIVGDWGYFPTPSDVARQMITEMLSHVDIDECNNFRILEPSCGAGNIVEELVLAADEGGHNWRIEANEWNVELQQAAQTRIRNLIRTRDTELVAEWSTMSFEALADLEAGEFDVVFMNPPFENANKHILWAMKACKDGGLIVSVLPANWPNSKVASANLSAITCGTAYMGETKLYAEAFKPSGTSVNTKIVVWKKHGVSK